MLYKIVEKKGARIAIILLVIPIIAGLIMRGREMSAIRGNAEKKENFIKYAEFNVSCEAMDKAIKLDIKSRDEDTKLNYIEILAYLGAKYGGEYKNRYKDRDMDELAQKLKDGENIDVLSENMKYYKYYKQVYTAVLGGFVGEYGVETCKDQETGEIKYETKYGLKAFNPIAKTFPYQHYDDFGAKRTYGYSRPHLGHDLMAAVGTPVIAIESGTVEIMGWNQYGGWRIGIRSFDKLRYYYYAHLRKDKPFHDELKEGKIVRAGDVIGYVGRTGYSTKENQNNIETSHLHLGLELVFDESQKESNNEIWVDLYEITRLLAKNQSAVKRDTNSKQFHREKEFTEPSLCSGT